MPKHPPLSHWHQRARWLPAVGRQRDSFGMSCRHVVLEANTLLLLITHEPPLAVKLDWTVLVAGVFLEHNYKLRNLPSSPSSGVMVREPTEREKDEKEVEQEITRQREENARKRLQAKKNLQKAQDHQRLNPSVSHNWILGKRYERASEQKRHPSIFIDGFNEAAWGDTCHGNHHKFHYGKSQISSRI